MWHYALQSGELRLALLHNSLYCSVNVFDAFSPLFFRDVSSLCTLVDAD